MAMQARRVQMIIACNLIARLTRSKPSINFSALGMLTCAAFSGQATHPSSIGADSSIWQQVAENSCQRRGDVIEAQAGAVCDGQRHHPGTTGGSTRNQHVKAVGGGHETNFDHGSAPRRTRTDAARGLWLRVRGGSCATKRSSSAIGINVRLPSRTA